MVFSHLVCSRHRPRALLSQPARGCCVFRERLSSSEAHSTGTMGSELSATSCWPPFPGHGAGLGTGARVGGGDPLPVPTGKLEYVSWAPPRRKWTSENWRDRGRVSAHSCPVPLLVGGALPLDKKAFIHSFILTKFPEHPLCTRTTA